MTVSFNIHILFQKTNKTGLRICFTTKMELIFVATAELNSHYNDIYETIGDHYLVTISQGDVVINITTDTG